MTTLTVAVIGSRMLGVVPKFYENPEVAKMLAVIFANTSFLTGNTMRRFCVHALMVTSALAAATDLRAQDSARIEIRSLGSTNVSVTQQGRVLATTLPTSLTLASGVQNLRVGDQPHCIYFEPRATARLIVISESPAQLTGARKCEDIWSEVTIDSVPSGLSIRASRGEITKQGSSVVIRVPLPDSLRLTIDGIGYATQSGTVNVGAMERATYVLRLAPSQPTLLADTIVEVIPSELLPPATPRLLRIPEDPTRALADATARLNLMRSRQPAARTSSALTVPFTIAAATAVVVGLAWAADSAEKHPQLGRTLGISLGVTGGIWAVRWPFNSTANKRASEAGCTTTRSAWSKCEARLKSDVDRIGEELRTFPMRRAQWATDTLQQQQSFRRALDEYPALRAAQDSLVRAIETRNQGRTANRSENESRTRVWQTKVRESPLAIRARAKRAP